MATDYDAPRKTEEDTESIQALQERVPDKLSGVVDSEDADNLGSLELAGQDLANVELDVVVLPLKQTSSRVWNASSSSTGRSGTTKRNWERSAWSALSNCTGSLERGNKLLGFA